MRCTAMTFSDLKRIVNSMDESIWGDKNVLASDGATTFDVYDLSTLSGVPASPEGSAAARWYGVHDAVPSRIEFQIVDRRGNKPRMLPIFNVSVDDKHVATVIFDARLQQLRNITNPHDSEDIDQALVYDLRDVAVGETYETGGGASSTYRYARLA